MKRLKTNYLDLDLLHWPSIQYPIKETMHAMEKLRDEGVIRFIEVSNFNVKEVQEAEQSLKNERIACNQVLYHLEYRKIESSIISYCMNHEIAVVGYFPFGHGKFPLTNTDKGKALAEISNKYKRTAHQIALKFLSNNNKIFVISKSSDIQHIKENCEAIDTEWNLKEDDIKEIKKYFQYKIKMKHYR